MLPAALAAFLLSSILTPLIARWARRRNLLDIPNDRSAHVVAMPRTGGPALVAGLLGGVLVLRVADVGVGTRGLEALGFALVLAALGLADDLRPLPALARLIVQAGLSLLLVATLGLGSLSSTMGVWLAVVVAVFWLVALSNAYNFMDGIDGIAGAQAVIAGLGWAAIGAITDSRDAAALGLLVACACAGFLLYNWQPANVFMGDSGAAFLGFLFAALPMTVPQPRPDVMLWSALLMWPFLFDTGFTLFSRLSRGENLLSAHRSHLYQRLTLTGRSHRQVALLYAGMALLGAVASVSLAARQATAALLSLVAIGFAAFGLWRHVRSRETTMSGRVPGNVIL